MDIKQAISFLKENIYLMLVLITLITPFIWGIISFHYNERLKTLDKQIELLELEISQLKEKNEDLILKKDEYKKLMIQSTEYEIDFDRLYTPSENLNK